MEKVRLGVIGAGGIAAILHLPELAELSQVEVRLVAGRKPERLQRLCQDYGIPAWTQSYDEVVADPQLDAVVVATPHPLHVRWAVAALEAGKHVLVQKPLCADLDEADALVAAAEKSDRTVLCLPHFSPSVHALQQQCAAGAIGRISGARCRSAHGGPEVYYAGVRREFGETEDDSLWFFDAAQASVGALFDMGVYAVASLVAVLGSARRVVGATATFDKPTQLEDQATLVLEMANGGLATAETSWCDPARSRELSIHGTAGKFTAPGVDGAEVTQWTPTSYSDERAPVEMRPLDCSQSLGNAHRHFVDCIGAGHQPPLSHVWAARHVTEILLAGLESGRSGRAVDLRTRAEPS
ncbi:MAG: hypothetical protein GKR89_24520 [Candidatus Latescibacteria bacterium]|nr:hypothetical protein [Candidatus Latescibacterota bacterium]